MIIAVETIRFFPLRSRTKLAYVCEVVMERISSVVSLQGLAI